MLHVEGKSDFISAYFTTFSQWKNNFPEKGCIKFFLKLIIALFFDFTFNCICCEARHWEETKLNFISGLDYIKRNMSARRYWYIEWLFLDSA